MAIMKTVMLIVAGIITLSGCSASYKGDIKSSNSSESANNRTSLVSYTGSTPSGSALYK